jgi:hypothetical protein
MKMSRIAIQCMILFFCTFCTAEGYGNYNPNTTEKNDCLKVAQMTGNPENSPFGIYVKSTSGKAVSGIKVYIKKNGQETVRTTDANGYVDGGDDRTVSIRLENPVELVGYDGVTTMDLVLIQRHILSLSQLPNPGQIIAGDANNDGKLTAGDLVITRKVVLGILDDFPNNKKIRFVHDNFPFPLNPFMNILEFDQYKEVYPLIQNDRINIIMVVTGDINR